MNRRCYSTSCSGVIPRASDSFIKELFRGVVSGLSILARAGWLICAFWASSSCVRPLYSRQALIKLSPRTFALTTSFGKKISFSWSCKSDWYSSQGRTAKAGLPSCFMIVTSVCPLISLFNLLDLNYLKGIVKQYPIAANPHPVVVCMISQWLYIERRTIRKCHQLIDRIKNSFPIVRRNFLYLFACSVMPKNVFHVLIITYYNICTTEKVIKSNIYS